MTAGLFCLLGGLLGFLYDILGGVRDRFPQMSAPADGLFWLCAGMLLFASGMGTPEGRLRPYMAAATVLGGALWGAGVSPSNRRVWKRLFGAAVWGVEMLLLPGKKAADWMKSSCGRV